MTNLGLCIFNLLILSLYFIFHPKFQKWYLSYTKN